MSSDTVFETHEIARSLTAADLTPAQADAITAAVRKAAEHDAAAADTLATKADLAALEARIYRAMLVQAGAIVGAPVGIAGIVVGALRLLG